MTMSLFAGCIGNGDVVPEEKMRMVIQKNRQYPERHRR